MDTNENINNEIWRPVEGYEGLYEVSNLGRVKSIARIDSNNHFVKERILKLDCNGKDYIQITLFKDNKRKKYLVHRLVAIAFIPNPNKYKYINHKDRNTKNNCVYLNKDGTVNVEKTNLEWCTQKYNIHYDGCLERRSISQRNNVCSVCVIQYTKDGKYVKEWPSTKEVQRILGINHSNISRCCLGKVKSAGGSIWKYKKTAA